MTDWMDCALWKYANDGEGGLQGIEAMNEYLND